MQDFKLNELNKIFQKYNINPKSIAIYINALTHNSYSNEHHLNYNYERLEFLGDTCIQYMVTHYLFNKKPELSEGNMTVIRSGLVCSKTLSKACDILGLTDLILVGKGVSLPLPVSIKENVFEAFMGAVVKDQGIKKASTIINDTIIKLYINNEISVNKKYKSLLQEAFSPKKLKYVITNGARCNDNYVEVKVMVDDICYGSGSGSSQHEAQENAAYNAYLNLSVNEKED